MPVLISAAELGRLQDTGAPLVILDARFDVARQDIRPAVETPHIPGALYVDVATELAGDPTALSGRRPLPQIRDLQRDARRWGIDPDSIVVVYDENRNIQAARVWWVLRWAGVKDVRLLNGGFGAWTGEGRPTMVTVKVPATGTVTLSAGHLPVVDAAGAAAVAGQGILLDARARDAYLAGHIPGAVNVPSAESLGTGGVFKAVEDLRARFADAGVDGSRPVAAYCGAGIASAHAVAVLASLGIEAALYPGSWSAWSADPSRPVATDD
ncbi:sulfurtransferase [Inquilinus limosus]|uniref:Rhodanese domain-containing protein n=1 Tax=Inquilinus limosus TaxID=171674 RepID=A0A211ZV55_9PROT|nr:sulfurtransferase [Inquilinus limosus]OWJ69182.1 hypothetical protein BWR60_01225 [Inquilinus limosus]